MAKTLVVAIKKATKSPLPTTVCCPIFDSKVITLRQCREESLKYRRNKEICSPHCCSSPARVCRICLLQGEQSEENKVSDIKKGLCRFHLENGEDARRSERSLIPPPREEDFITKVLEECMPIAVTYEQSDSGDNGEKSADKKRRKEPAQAKYPNLFSRLILKTEKATKEKLEKIVWLEIDKVKPNPHQPRKYFNKKAMDGLKKSMEYKQMLPIIVSGSFEIIDGERRWRAAKLNGEKRIKAIVRCVKDKNEHFLESAIANFSREGHTSIEIARACQKIKEMGLNSTEIGDLFSKSNRWVELHLLLLNLHPQVQEMLIPDEEGEEQLKFTVATEIAKIPDQKVQYDLAKEIVLKGIKLYAARHLIRRVIKQKNITIQGRGKRPDNDFKALKNLISRTSDSLEIFLSMDLQKLFAFRPPEAKKDTISALKSLKERIQELIDAI